jgi:tRNA (mo5U34)-methyltransferase
MRWYHTLELPGGVLTPGEYDLRPIVDRLPWPASLEGLRCLDVGSRDGFYAFEMERRGAAEVVALDVDDPADLDLPHPRPPEDVVAEVVAEGNRAFAAAHAALGSAVARRGGSVHAVDPGQLGTFDLVVVGTLLAHLRDPVGALAVLRGCVRGRLLVVDHVPAGLLSLLPWPHAELMARGGPFWWEANPAGLARMLEAAGFRVLERGRPFVIPFGAGGGPELSLRQAFARPLTGIPRRLVDRRGALHAWLLAEPVTAPTA